MDAAEENEGSSEASEHSIEAQGKSPTSGFIVQNARRGTCDPTCAPDTQGGSNKTLSYTREAVLRKPKVYSVRNTNAAPSTSYYHKKNNKRFDGVFDLQ
jgi:hypothetical protein